MSDQGTKIKGGKEIGETRYGLGASSATSFDDFAIKKRRGQVLEYMSLEGKTILDIGCGNGLYTLSFTDLAKNVVGIDIVEEQIAEARRNSAIVKGDAKFLIASAENLPFNDGSFDVVLAIEMLEHVRSEEQVLQEANRVLKSQGYLLIYVPNKLYPFDEHGIIIGKRHFKGLYGSIPFLSWAPLSIRNRFANARIYTRKQIVAILEKTGFIILEVDYMYPPLDKLKGITVKSTLRKIMAILERNRFLKRFGMSLFLVAQKR